MKFPVRVSAALFVMTVVMSAPAAQAQYEAVPPWKGAPPQSQSRPHPRLAACSSKSAGDTCTFSRNGHTLSGSCQPLGGGQLACIDVIGRPGVMQHPADAGMSAGDLPNQ